MKRLTIAAAILSALPMLAPLSAQAPSATRTQGVAWHEDLDSALAEAKTSHKPVFLDIWAEWCPPCQRMRQQVFPAPQAQAALKKVVAASVMVEKQDRTPIPAGVAVDQRYGSGAYPTLLILDGEGKVVRRHTGALDAAALAKFISGE
ncbi:MAG TPA: thioredoxin family protein [Holophagaceae bacterium]|nr:thioredoxin family protein [Holophagaceae bacterium]